jgi:DNA polymerase III subunit beta
MKFTSTAGALSSALDAAALALNDKVVISALAMARISARGDHASFTVDSLDRRITAKAEVTVIEPGAASARCDALAGIAGGLPPEREVKIESHDDGVIVRAGRSRFLIAGLPLDTLPQSGELSAAAASFALDADDLRRMLEVCQHAISDEETRYYLNGVFLHTTGKVLRGVATDGHRLAWLDLPLPAEADGMPGVIVPGKIVAILIKLLKRKPPIETISLRTSEKLIELSFPSLSLTAKLIDGTFPDYIRIIPKASNNTVTVAVDELRHALARVEALFDPKSKRGMRTVGLSWSNGALHVSLTSENETDDVIDNAKIGGAGRFAARISYLFDAIEAFNGKEITLDTNGPKSPAVRITDPNDTAPFAIVMPVRF